LFILAIHETADKGKTFPKGAQIQPHRTRAVRFPQLVHLCANKHKRHPATAIMLYTVERTPDTMQKGRKVEIVGDYGWCLC
jgi:hypothetical protein